MWAWRASGYFSLYRPVWWAVKYMEGGEIIIAATKPIHSPTPQAPGYGRGACTKGKQSSHYTESPSHVVTPEEQQKKVLTPSPCLVRMSPLYHIPHAMHGSLSLHVHGILTGFKTYFQIIYSFKMENLRNEASVWVMDGVLMVRPEVGVDCRTKNRICHSVRLFFLLLLLLNETAGGNAWQSTKEKNKRKD